MAKVSAAKAKKILEDGKVNGKDLSPKQRKFFGAIAGGAKMEKAQEGTFVSEARDNLIQGLQEGGIMAPQSGPLTSEGGNNELVALAQVLNALDPAERQNRLDALTLGLQSARGIHRKSLGTAAGPASMTHPRPLPLDFPTLLQNEVQRAYDAILAGSQTPAPSMGPVA